MKLSQLTLALVLIASPVVAAAQDLDATVQSLKDAVAKKDVPTVKKLAADVSAAAKQILAEPAPSPETDVYKEHIAFAKDVEKYSEYALFSTAIGAAPEVTVDLISDLEAQNPKSEYLDTAYGPYFRALQQTGQAAKVPGIADKALASLPDNEDLLLVAANGALERKNLDRAFTLSSHLAAVASKASKPEGVPQADWDRKRNSDLARGYWISGVVSCERQKYTDCDRNLRAALPLVQGNDSMKGPALLYLGIANYQLGVATADKKRVLEGQKYSEDAADIKGAWTQQAWTNAQNMKAYAAKMR